MKQRPLRQYVTAFVSGRDPGAMLPSDSELALRFGLSRATVLRMMARLAAEGVVERVQGKGTFVPGRIVEHAPAQLPERTESLTRLVKHIIRAINLGELRRGNLLPSYKQMCAAFHVGAATVAQAYRLLENKGIVSRAGQYYQVGRFTSILRESSSRSIYLFAPSVESIRALFTENLLAMSLVKMEHELSLHGCTVYYELHERFAQYVSTWKRQSRFPQGIVITGSTFGGVLEYDYEFFKPHLDTLFLAAGSARPRVSALASYFCWPDPRVVTFSVKHSVTAVKRNCALFLFKNRIKRVRVYIDEEKSSGASLVDDMRIIPELEHIDPDIDVRLAVRTDDFDGFVRHCVRQLTEDNYTTRLSKYRPFTFDEMLARMEPVESIEQMCAASATPSAWLFNFDDEAARALAWCHAHKVAVPRQVSIVSFENSRRYSHLGITCCVCDWDTIGYLLAHSLISDVPFEKTRRGFVALPSLLFERRT